MVCPVLAHPSPPDVISQAEVEKALLKFANGMLCAEQLAGQGGLLSCFGMLHTM